MFCPYCNNDNDKVIDSRSVDNGRAIRRRRECKFCNGRFSTTERIEQAPLQIRKRDGRIVPFDPIRIMTGIKKAVANVSEMSDRTIQSICNEIAKEVINSKEEVTSKLIGDLVLDKLQATSEVAYVRYASVYQKFQGSDDFALLVEDMRKRGMHSDDMYADSEIKPFSK